MDKFNNCGTDSPYVNADNNNNNGILGNHYTMAIIDELVMVGFRGVFSDLIIFVTLLRLNLDDLPSVCNCQSSGLLR